MLQPKGWKIKVVTKPGPLTKHALSCGRSAASSVKKDSRDSSESQTEEERACVCMCVRARQIRGRNERAGHYTKLWERRTKWHVNNKMYLWILRGTLSGYFMWQPSHYFPAIRLTKWSPRFLHVWIPLFRLDSPVAFHHMAHNLMQDGEMAVNLQVIRP